MPRLSRNRSTSPQKQPTNPDKVHVLNSQENEREDLCRQIQEMFQDTVEPEVVELVLTECNWRVDDAIENLFAMVHDDEFPQTLSSRSDLDLIACSLISDTKDEMTHTKIESRQKGFEESVEVVSEVKSCSGTVTSYKANESTERAQDIFTTEREIEDVFKMGAEQGQNEGNVSPHQKCAEAFQNLQPNIDKKYAFSGTVLDSQKQADSKDKISGIVHAGNEEMRIDSAKIDQLNKSSQDLNKNLWESSIWTDSEKAVKVNSCDRDRSCIETNRRTHLERDDDTEFNKLLSAYRKSCMRDSGLNESGKEEHHGAEGAGNGCIKGDNSVPNHEQVVKESSDNCPGDKKMTESVKQFFSVFQLENRKDDSFKSLNLSANAPEFVPGSSSMRFPLFPPPGLNINPLPQQLPPEPLARGPVFMTPKGQVSAQFDKFRAPVPQHRPRGSAQPKQWSKFPKQIHSRFGLQRFSRPPQPVPAWSQENFPSLGKSKIKPHFQQPQIIPNFQLEFQSSEDNSRQAELRSTSDFHGTSSISFSKVTSKPSYVNSTSDLDVWTSCEPKPARNESVVSCTEQVKLVQTCVAQGKLLLVLIRGLPGSGKSYLARQMVSDGVILSTDDYFIWCGEYKYVQEKLSDAHAWNKYRARDAMDSRRNPIIIDNTNTMEWEMLHYVKLAVARGYDVEVFEPNTPWKFQLKILAKKNCHGVGREALRKMNSRYQHNITAAQLVTKARLQMSEKGQEEERSTLSDEKDVSTKGKLVAYDLSSDEEDLNTEISPALREVQPVLDTSESMPKVPSELPPDQSAEQTDTPASPKKHKRRRKKKHPSSQKLEVTKAIEDILEGYQREAVTENDLMARVKEIEALVFMSVASDTERQDILDWLQDKLRAMKGTPSSDTTTNTTVDFAASEKRSPEVKVTRMDSLEMELDSICSVWKEFDNHESGSELDNPQVETNTRLSASSDDFEVVDAKDDPWMQTGPRPRRVPRRSHEEETETLEAYDSLENELKYWNSSTASTKKVDTASVTLKEQVVQNYASWDIPLPRRQISVEEDLSDVSDSQEQTLMMTSTPVHDLENQHTDICGVELGDVFETEHTDDHKAQLTDVCEVQDSDVREDQHMDVCETQDVRDEDKDASSDKDHTCSAHESDVREAQHMDVCETQDVRDEDKDASSDKDHTCSVHESRLDIAAPPTETAEGIQGAEQIVPLICEAEHEVRTGSTKETPDGSLSEEDDFKSVELSEDEFKPGELDLHRRIAEVREEELEDSFLSAAEVLDRDDSLEDVERPSGDSEDRKVICDSDSGDQCDVSANAGMPCNGKGTGNELKEVEEVGAILSDDIDRMESGVQHANVTIKCGNTDVDGSVEDVEGDEKMAAGTNMVGVNIVKSVEILSVESDKVAVDVQSLCKNTDVEKSVEDVSAGYDNKSIVDVQRVCGNAETEEIPAAETNVICENMDVEIVSTEIDSKAMPDANKVVGNDDIEKTVSVLSVETTVADSSPLKGSSPKKSRPQRRNQGKSKMVFLDTEVRQQFQSKNWSSFAPLHVTENTVPVPGADTTSDARDCKDVDTTTDSYDFSVLYDVNNYKPVSRNKSSDIYTILTAYSRDINSGTVNKQPEIHAKAVASFDKGCMTSDLEEEVHEDLEFLLKAFPEAEVEHLKESLEICQGNMEWTINLLLDWGYMMPYSVQEHEEIAKEMKLKTPDKVMKYPDFFQSESPSSLFDLCQKSIVSNNLADLKEIQKKVISTGYRRLQRVESHSLMRIQSLNHSDLNLSSVSDNCDIVEELTKEEFQHDALFSHEGRRQLSSPLGAKFDSKDLSDDPDQLGDLRHPQDHEEAVVTIPIPNDLVRDLEELFGPVSNRLKDCEAFEVSLDLTTARYLFENLKARPASRLAGIQKTQEERKTLEQQLKEDEALARQLQQEENKITESQPGESKHRTRGNRGNSHVKTVAMAQASKKKPVCNLMDIMEEEKANQERREQQIKLLEATGDRIAISTTLKRQKLYNSFPGVDENFLEEIFEANGYNLEDTVYVLQEAGGRKITPRTVTGPSNKMIMREKTEQKGLQDLVDQSWSMQSTERRDFQTLDASGVPDYDEIRGEANLHFNMRNECFQKAQDAFRRGMKDVASFYSHQGHLHTKKMKEANMRASEKILEARSSMLMQRGTLDLHGLHVDEAISILKCVIAEREEELRERPDKRKQSLLVITGRGSHSRGGVAKLRPAIINHLSTLGYIYEEQQPGLIKIFMGRR